MSHRIRSLSVLTLSTTLILIACGSHQSAWAGSSGQLCIQQKIGGNPSCTANDVRISSLVATGGPITCVPGDFVNATLVATIESGPARYDIGLWINETGGSALSDPTGTCYRDYLHPRSANNFGCSQSYPGPYFNGEPAVAADVCGDVPASNGPITCGAPIGPCSQGGGTCLFTTYQFTATFKCFDTNNDGTADLSTATSWDNNTSHTCTNELDTDPGTGSKCNVGVVTIGNIFIDPCVSANCNDNIACTVDTCDSSSGSAVCSHTPSNDLCNDGQYCNGVETCSAVTGCQAGTPVSCNDGVACTNDFCNEAIDQCDSTPSNANCSDSMFCNGVEICDPVLNCLPGTAPYCDDGVVCTNDSCNEATDQCDNVADNSNCSDGQFCNGIETCDPTNDCQAGTPPDCGDGVACTVDSCDEVGDACVHAPNDASCDNGLYCDGSESCNAISGCQSGTPVNCNDGVTCTVDSCNEAADTCSNIPDNTACGDGLFCTGVELCDPVNDCQPGTDPCPGILCDEVNDVCAGCLTDANCDNGVYCDGAESCDTDTSTCISGMPIDCDDAVTCTLDACNEITDQCDHEASNALCDDGQFCNGAETCDILTDCQAGTPPNCDDAIGCTDDSCNEAIDQCDHVANDANCSNEAFCDGVEICSPVSDCQPGTPPNCNDGVSCTADSCSPGLNACVNTPNDAVCSNGQYCDGAEICDLVNDCQPGIPPSCDDAVACTVDVCDEIGDVCENVAIDANCDDGQFCNGAETCDPLNDCIAGSVPNCEDGVGCTTDACDETNDLCTHAADDALCNNGLYCDGVEQCDPTDDCEPGIVPDCSDTYDCTVDICDEIGDTCVNDATACVCGDNEIGPGEDCDPPSSTPGGEICDNLIDDDGDGAIDCEDEDCPAFCEHDPSIPCSTHHDCRMLTIAKTSCIGAPSGCDDNCQLVVACNAIGRDPSIIRFGRDGRPDLFKMHASFVPQTMMDPAVEGFSFLLTNASGVVYQAQLLSGDLKRRGKGYFYKDVTARAGEGLRDGVYQLRLKQRVKDGRLDYSFTLQIYGDFSAATEALMMTQVKVGNDGTMIAAEWTQTGSGWKLDQNAY